MSSTRRDPLVGGIVDGRYEVLARLARGGMSTVYLALDTRLDREVALKADVLMGDNFVVLHKVQAFRHDRVVLIFIFPNLHKNLNHILHALADGSFVEDRPQSVEDEVVAVWGVLR